MHENRLVVADEGWAKEAPQWLLDEIKTERLIGAIADDNKNEVGDAETALYLFTASLKAPMSHELNQCYLHLCGKLMQKRGIELDDFFKKTELSSDEERELSRIKRELFKVRGGRIKIPIIEMLKKVRGSDEL